MKDRKWQKEYYFFLAYRKKGRKEGREEERKEYQSRKDKKGRKESSSETEQVAYFRQQRDPA